MLAVIASSQSVTAVLAAANDCCVVPGSLPPQQPQHSEPHPQPAQAQPPRDAVTTQMTVQQTLPIVSSKQLKQEAGVLQVHNDQGAATSAAVAAASGAAGAVSASAVADAVTVEPSSSAAAVPATRSERRKSERRLSRGERRLSSGNKAVVAPVAGYSTDSYWNSRYAERSTHFDWFYNYSALAELITTTCDSQAGPCLHVGCGNSGFSEGMVQDGFQVVNVDISPVVIEQMRLMEQHPGQRWEVADCRSMPQYEDASFGSVLDKGTLDAVLCSSHGTVDAVSYINEVHRLLAPGGVFLLISLGQPHARLTALRALPAETYHSNPLPYLSADLQQRAAATNAAAAAAAAAVAGATAAAVSDASAAAGKEGGGSDRASPSSVHAWQWESVEVYLLPKPSLYMQSESSLTGKPIIAHMRHSDKDVPVEWLGPLTPGEELDAFIAQEHLDMREFFTAFACTKGAGDAAAAAGSAPEPATAAAPAGLDAAAAAAMVERSG